MVNLRGTLPGVLLVLAVTVVSILISLAHSALDPLVLSIIIGLLLSSLISGNEGGRRGVDASLAVFLPVGIALYGMQLNFMGVRVGPWPMVVVAFFVMFTVAYLFSRYAAGLDHGLSLLIATGLSVCGATAIVVVAAAAGARREDTTASIISVVIAGGAGMVIYRLMAGTSVLPPEGMPLLLGTTLPMLGQVKVAALAFGQDVMKTAVNYKVLRLSFLALVAVVVLAFCRRQGAQRRRPWFMAAFFLFAALANTFEGVASLRGLAGQVSEVLLTAALASIGLSVDLDEMAEKGLAPPISAGVSWGFASLVMALAYIVVL